MRNSRRSRSSEPRLRSDGPGRRGRQELAAYAARLIAETGLRDFEDAKLRAAEAFGIHDHAGLPSNQEIDSELRAYQRLFQSQSQPKALRQRRQAAAPAMQFFAQFEPRLVGAVLDGSADDYSAVCLHLFADDPRAVEWFLADRQIPYESFERTFRQQDRQSVSVPAYRFERDGLEFDLTVFELDDLRHPPLDRVTLKPMKRADRPSVEKLLAQDSGVRL